MNLTRRQLLAAAAALGLAGCAPATTARTAPPAAPIDGPGALIDWIAAQPDRASVLLDDGRGTTVEHLSGRPRPIGSAGKVVHLVAYAQAVAAGRLDPATPVTVAEWERWYVPGHDGGAHPAALQALGVTPGGTVRWDDVAAAMIDFSDNAAPDLLRATLGDAALVDAAASAGWTAPDLPNYAGEVLISDEPVPGDRRAAALAAARAYADDPAQRAAYAQAAGARTATPEPTGGSDPAIEAALRWWDDAPAGTATQLAGLHRAAATDGLGVDVSSVVRRHLERVLADKLPGGVVGAGQKGGSLPGLLTNAFTLRRADGTVAVSVVSLSGMPWTAYQEALTSGAVQLLSQQALLDDTLRERLRTAVGAR